MKSTNEPGSIVVLHREFVADVIPSSSYSLSVYPINPGLPQSFPWLSQITDAYESYRLKGLVYEFRTRQSETFAGTQTASLGSVIMATDYNVLNPPFSTKMEMENYQFSTSSAPTKSFIHAVELSRRQSPLSVLYLRNNQIEVGDKRFHDFGNFQIATSGCQVGADPANILPCGELWVTYEVELYKPKFRSIFAPTDHYMIIFPSSNFSANMVAKTPLTNVDYLDAKLPAPDIRCKYTNGVFRVGTWITKFDLGGVNAGNYINFPTSSSGKRYQIVIIWTTSHATQRLCDAAGAVPRLQLDNANCVNCTGIYCVNPNAGAQAQINATTSFPSSFTVANATATQNLDCIHLVCFVQINHLTGNQFARAAILNPTGVIPECYSDLGTGKHGYIDVYVTEVDPVVFPTNDEIKY